MKYSYTHIIAFKSKKGSVIITKSYNNDDEYFNIMDNINSDEWEILFDKVNK